MWVYAKPTAGFSPRSTKRRSSSHDSGAGLLTLAGMQHVQRRHSRDGVRACAVLPQVRYPHRDLQPSRVSIPSLPFTIYVACALTTLRWLPSGGFFAGKIAAPDADAPTGGRFDPNSNMGKTYRARYLKSAYFDALNHLKPIAVSIFTSFQFTVRFHRTETIPTYS